MALETLQKLCLSVLWAAPLWQDAEGELQLRVALGSCSWLPRIQGLLNRETMNKAMEQT